MVTPVDAETYAEVVDVLSRHALLVDNRIDQREGAAEAYATAYLPAPAQAMLGGLGAVYDVPGRVPFPHHTTDVAVHRVDDSTLRVWSKFFTIRGDGTAGSGDYQDTLVRTASGWRISERAVSRGQRPADDPDGPSTRSLDRASWMSVPTA